MALDFTKLDSLAYRDFDTPEAQRAKDEMIEAGFTIVEDDANPFEATGAADRPPEPPQAAEVMTPQQPARKARKALQSHTGTDYRGFYRLACNFHEKYNPPRADAAYWDAVADEMTEITNQHNQHPFLTELLIAVFSELEREYKAQQK